MPVSYLYMAQLPDHPDYPIDSQTGLPARSPEDLETAEHLTVRRGIDPGPVFDMKHRLGPLDDSDVEAEETYRRFTSGRPPENVPSDEQLLSALAVRLSAFAEDERYIRRQGGIANVGECFGRHIEELRIFRSVTCRSLDPRSKSVIDLEFGLGGEDPQPPQEVARALGIPEGDFAEVRRQAMLDAARNHRLAGYLTTRS